MKTLKARGEKIVMPKRAVILAGGKGTRLRPYTVVLPKPLMPIGDYPILEIVVRQLARDGFDHITLAVNHQADIIKSYFNNGNKWGVKIDYSLEKKPLGTMGPLKIIPDLPDNFLIMNGDILSDLDYGSFLNYHIENKNSFTISSCERSIHSEFGVLEINKEKQLVSFKEKPIYKFFVSMGAYGVSRKILQYIPSNKVFGFDDLMHDLISANITISSHVHEGKWLDIGRGEDYSRAIQEYEINKTKFLK